MRCSGSALLSPDRVIAPCDIDIKPVLTLPPHLHNDDNDGMTTMIMMMMMILMMIVGNVDVNNMKVIVPLKT